MYIKINETRDKEREREEARGEQVCLVVGSCTAIATSALELTVVQFSFLSKKTITQHEMGRKRAASFLFLFF